MDFKKEIKEKEYSNARASFIGGLGLQELFGSLDQGEQFDETCFRLNPPTQYVKLYLKKIGSTKKPLCVLPDDKGVVSLDSLEDNLEYEVEVRSTNTTPELLLHSFNIKKDDNGAVSVQSVDTRATIIESVFKRKDIPLTGAAVLGNFTSSDGLQCTLKGTTDAEGKYTIVLPQGIIENFQANNGEFVVPKHGKIVIPPANPSSTPRKTKVIIIEVDPSTFSSGVAPQGDNPQIVILGDISGSMQSRIDILKRSFLDIFEMALKKNWKVALAAWDTSVEWCTTEWIQSHQRDIVTRWVSARHARGGNNMKQAIEEALRKFPSATDIYIMCDGDVSPFKLHSWGAFRNSFTGCVFNFIALGKASNAETMEQMASIGGGTFWESN